MLGGPSRVPKIVSVRVHKAERLRIIPKSDGKQKKISQKWKVVFLGGKKKMSSGSILAPAGNPVWDYEVTFKVAVRGEPISLLVTDSDDHHVGQVVIPVTTMPPRPTNPQERPTDPSRLQISDLEPTKKVETPNGILYYWVWVEEYRAEDDVKSSRASMLSIRGNKRDKKAGSVADSLNYSGSLLSVNSSQPDVKHGKRRNIFKRKHGKDIRHSALDLTNPSLGSRSTYEPATHSQIGGSIYDPTNFNSRPTLSEFAADDHDGSVLGAYSDITGSELNNRPGQLLPDMPGRNIPLLHQNRQSAIISPSPARHISTVSEVSQNARNSVYTSPQPTPIVSAAEPVLISLNPSSCSTEGGVEVSVVGRHLTEDVMRYATILVDGYTVQRQDWFHQESKSEGSDKSELRVHMPARPTGRCWIELETMGHGRLRCPQEFSYVQTSALNNVNKAETPSGATPMSRSGITPLIRTGSQRSSLIVRDGRSTRRRQRPQPAAVATDAISGESAHDPTNDMHINHDDYGDQVKDDISPTNKSGISQPFSVNDSGISSLPEPSNRTVKESYTGLTKDDDFNYIRASEKPTLFNQPPQTPASFRYKPTDERTPKSTASASESSDENSVFAGTHQNFGLHLRNSGRSAASGQSRSLMDENSKLEMDGLRETLKDANSRLESMKKHTLDLEQQLSNRNAEVESLSSELCSLRNRLLADGATKYLEKVHSFF